MSSLYVLDAHVLVWFLEGNKKLSIAARQCIEDTSAQLILPAIALAEICWMVEKGKCALTLAEVRTSIDIEARLSIEPLDKETVYTAQRYPALEIHDRLILAVAERQKIRNVDVALITADMMLHGSGIARTIW
jgi:PIN domain nuclease of toxin-antitoxin system